MAGRDLTIVSGAKGKGRSFRAAVLAMASAPVWDRHEASNDRIRPAFLVVGCQHQEAGPVLANLRTGNVATLTGDDLYHKGVALEMLKSVKYAWSTARLGSGVVLTARLHSTVAVDPGIVEPDLPVRFLVVPPKVRLEQELLLLPSDEMRAYGRKLAAVAFAKGAYDWMEPALQDDSDEWRYAPALAAWFCAMVDRRVPVPILPDPLFQMRFYLACLRTGLAGWAHSEKRHGSKWGREGPKLTEWGYGSIGLAPGVAFAATQDAVRDLLVEEVRGWVDAGSSTSAGQEASHVTKRASEEVRAWDKLSTKCTGRSRSEALSSTSTPSS